MKQVYFITDFFYDDFSLGGAELADHEVIKGLEKAGVSVGKINTRFFTPSLLEHLGYDQFFIVSNFMQLRKSTMAAMVRHSVNYVIYEHDHKYLMHRNPTHYVDYKAPKHHLMNVDFYNQAQVVYCQSKLHEKCITTNLPDAQVINLGASLWDDDFYELVSSLDFSQKNGKAAILQSPVDHKGQKEAVHFCQQRNIPYDLIQGENPTDLITKLSRYTALVFLPKLTETFCRVAVEARLVGCEVITNGLLGAASEPFFGWNHETANEDRLEYLKEKKKEVLQTFVDLSLRHGTSITTPSEDINFKIIVPSYNAEGFAKRCVDSIKNQAYKNFQCVIVDDASTDKSAEEFATAMGDDKRFTLVRNTENVGALENIVKGVTHMDPQDEDVIVNLDGDDRFSHPYVLDILHKTYTDTKCWMTYGSYEENDGKTMPTRGQFCQHEVPTEIIDHSLFREQPWMTSALRTFKHKLWKDIDHKDLKNQEGKYYEAAWDLAYMYPMLEMAGRRIEFIEDILYVYNQHPNNDHRVSDKRLRQLTYEREIRQKKKYMRKV